MLQVINGIDTLTTEAETLFNRIDEWCLEMSHIDMWVVAGHYTGTLYSDYRKGLRYIELFRQWVMAIIDNFVEAHTVDEMKLLAVAIVETNRLVLESAPTIEPVVVEPTGVSRGSAALWSPPKSTPKAVLFWETLSSKKYKLRGEAVALISEFSTVLPETVKRYKLRGSECVKISDLEGLIATM